MAMAKSEGVRTQAHLYIFAYSRAESTNTRINIPGRKSIVIDDKCCFYSNERVHHDVVIKATIEAKKKSQNKQNVCLSTHTFRSLTRFGIKTKFQFVRC